MSMKWLELLEDAMEEMINCCERRNGYFCSTEDDSAYVYLENIVNRLKAGSSEAQEIERLRKALPQLLETEEREEHSPTFDWYDDHHYIRIAIGQIAACRRAIRLYEGLKENETSDKD